MRAEAEAEEASNQRHWFILAVDRERKLGAVIDPLGTDTAKRLSAELKDIVQLIQSYDTVFDIDVCKNFLTMQCASSVTQCDPVSDSNKDASC